MKIWIKFFCVKVLNLIITGIPSILKSEVRAFIMSQCFKPYYNWNTFNTSKILIIHNKNTSVLNLIITGIPSILEIEIPKSGYNSGFKPYYNWNTFNTYKTFKTVYN